MMTPNPLFNIVWPLVCNAKWALQNYAFRKRWGRGRYSFSVSVPLKLGEPCGIHITDSPCLPMTVDEILMNAPCAGFVTIHSILIGNRSITVGNAEDAISLSGKSRASFKHDGGVRIIQPYERVTFSGSYTGLCHPPFEKGQPYTFCMRISGIQALSDMPELR